MKLYKTLPFLPLLIAVTLNGCSRYSVSINENIVYQPPTLFGDLVIADQNLKACIVDIIAENGLTKAEQLTRLICPPGNIQDLQGIETFTSVEYLGLAQNDINDIGVVAKLKALKQVDLTANNVSDFSPLTSLAGLVFINSQGNSHAQCETLDIRRDGLTIIVPLHCVSNKD